MCCDQAKVRYSTADTDFSTRISFHKSARSTVGGTRRYGVKADKATQRKLVSYLPLTSCQQVTAIPVYQRHSMLCKASKSRRRVSATSVSHPGLCLSVSMCKGTIGRVSISPRHRVLRYVSSRTYHWRHGLRERPIGLLTVEFRLMTTDAAHPCTFSEIEAVGEVGICPREDNSSGFVFLCGPTAR